MLEIEEKFPDQRIPRQGRGWLNFLEPGFLQRLNFNSRVGTAVGGGERMWQERCIFIREVAKMAHTWWVINRNVE